MKKQSIKAICAVICAAAVGIAAVLTAGAAVNCRAGSSDSFGGETSDETGGETGDETGGEIGSEIGNETTERINNPDQGFYRPVYVKLTDSGAQYNSGVLSGTTQLYHLRIDISAFSAAAGGADKPFTDGALNGLRSLLNEIDTREKSAVVRFAYDPNFSGKKDAEPDFDVLLGHIRQATAVLNGYETTITAIEAGLIGPWGEMHSSKISDSEHTTRLIDEFLKNTENLPVLVRTPKKIYDYLGITVNDIDGYEIPPSSPACRLGLYNDGYLGSDSDLGTYTDRARETEFLSKINKRLPFGGEVVSPESKLHDIENCTAEMFKLSLSYLNVEWNNSVIDKWKNTQYTEKCGNDKIYYGQSAFTYIENRLGYRFVLRNSKLNYSLKSGIFKGQIKSENVGFGNLTKQKQLKLYFTDQTGQTAYKCAAGTFNGGNEIYFSQKIELTSGKYSVYLCVYGKEINGSPAYCVRFANSDNWNEELKANYIGEITV